MADEIDGDEPGGRAAQKGVEARDLAGCAAIEHRSACVKMGLGLTETGARVALQVLGAAEGSQPFFPGDADVAQLQRVVKPCAVHDSALVQHGTRQRCEHAARRALAAHLVVEMPSGVQRGLAASLVEGAPVARCGADALAEAALGAAVGVDMRIGEPFGIALHGDARLRADLGASPTAGAEGEVMPGDKGQHAASPHV